MASLLVAGLAAGIAGNTGKIAGVIKDAQTGETLVGANVLVDGTTMGAASNIDGYYVILNIQPGKYTLVASAVGYNKRTITNVDVSIDQTTTIDIQITSMVVNMNEEVVVTAERPLVQRDQTAKTAVVGGEQIAALPVTEVAQVLSLQAGYVGGSLRGGRSGEVAYWIDGVPITDSYNGSNVVEVNKNLVQELQLVSGAFNAEYGQAMSGIVNIATKEGGSKYTGTLGFYGGGYAVSEDAVFPGTKFKPTAIRNYEVSASGPVTGDDLTFFANGRYIYFDGYRMGFRRFNPSNISLTDSTGNFVLYRNPSNGKGDSAVVPMDWSERWYGQAKLTWRISPVIKLTGNFIYDNNPSKAYDRTKDDNHNNSYFYNPDGYGKNYNTSNTFIYQLSHSLNPTTFYTLGGSWFEKKFKYYLYEDPNDPRYVHPKLFQTPDTYSFFTGGTDLAREFRSTRTFLTKLDLSSQVTSTHLLKAGAEFRTHRLDYERIDLQPIAEQQDLNLATGSPYIQTRILDISSSSHNLYVHHPKEMSAYIQDKMEFKDIIVNLGVRFDYFEPDGHVLSDPTDPNIYNPIKPGNRFFDNNGNGIKDAGEPDKTVADRQGYWYTKAKTKSQFSPRLGVSFPITARGIVHFSYGWFFQIPRFERLYENPDFKIGLGTGNQGIVGNADLKPEQTINGEIGVQQQLTDDIAVDVTAYLRDIRGLTGTSGEQVIIFGGSSSYSRYTNSDFGFVKGIILTLKKSFAAGLSATVDYTFQVARGSASDPQQAQKAVAGGAQPELQLTPLSWDQRHTLNVTGNYSASTWGVSTIAQYGTGQPYTPRSTQDISTILTNSLVRPDFFSIDLRAYYEFLIDPLKLVAFVRVFNLLDRRNEVNVFDDTGRAGFTTNEALARATNPAQYVNTLDQWFTVPVHYSEPRRIEFGLNLEF
jgi:outer membrane receptor for ferrienterochelin and colicin